MAYPTWYAKQNVYIQISIVAVSFMLSPKLSMSPSESSRIGESIYLGDWSTTQNLDVTCQTSLKFIRCFVFNFFPISGVKLKLSFDWDSPFILTMNFVFLHKATGLSPFLGVRDHFPEPAGADLKIRVQRSEMFRVNIEIQSEY